MEPGSRKFKERKPPPWAVPPEPMPWAEEMTGSNGQLSIRIAEPLSAQSHAASPGWTARPILHASNAQTAHKDLSETSQRADPGAAGGHFLNARSDPKFDARRRAKGAAENARESSDGKSPQSNKTAETKGAIPEPDEQPENESNGDSATENPSKANLAEIELIRSKLVVNGRVRLDLEALAVYLMCPSYFAIATGLDPGAVASAISSIATPSGLAASPRGNAASRSSPRARRRASR